MKGNLQALALAVATLSCVAGGGGGGGGAPSVLAIDQGAAGRTVQLRAGQLLTLSLPGNPTTGFSWELMPGAEPVLALQGEPSYTPVDGLIGGGSYRFTFLAHRKGRAPLRLIYRRSFEKEQPSPTTFEVTVAVD